MREALGLRNERLHLGDFALANDDIDTHDADCLPVLGGALADARKLLRNRPAPERESLALVDINRRVSSYLLGLWRIRVHHSSSRSMY
jgi:hypothetical protein